MDHDVAQFIAALRENGSENTDAALWGQFYDTLKSIAYYKLRGWYSGNTLSATMLVHETFLKLGGDGQRYFKDKEHFLAVSSLAMRQIIVQYLRQKHAKKRDHLAVSIDEEIIGHEGAPVDLLMVDNMMADLTDIDPRLARVVEARVFGGFSIDEIADHMNVSRRTIDRLWTKGKMILLRHIQSDGKSEGDSPRIS